VNVAKSHIDPEASEPLVPRRWAHATVSASMHCRNCGYDLRGLDASSRCPECGMDVWATVVHTIDPASSRLPSIRNPVAVGNSLLVLTVCLLIGGLLMAMPFVATAMESARSGSAAPGNANVWWRQLPQFNWPYALVLGLTGVWAIWTLAPPRGAEPGGPVWDDIWRLIVGYCGWVAAATMLASLSQPQADTSRHPRLVLVVTAGAFATIGLFGLRGVFHLIGQRSREYRRLLGSRQSVELIILAIGGAVLGRLIAYLAVFEWFPASWRVSVQTLGSVILSASMFMVLIGLAYLVMNAWWIRQALRSPPPAIDEVLLPRMPNDTWAMDRED
jgi:hypothetical protein